MAKGLFSWLGFGKKNKENYKVTEETAESSKEEKEAVEVKAGQEAEESLKEGKEAVEVKAGQEAEESLKEGKEAVEVKAGQEAEESLKEGKEAVEVKAGQEAEEFSKKEKDLVVAEDIQKAVIDESEAILSENNKDFISSKDIQENVSELDRKIDSFKEESAQKVKKSFFERLKKTRDNLAYGLSALIVGKKIDDELYEDLETALLTADLGVETTEFVIEKLKEESKARELHDAIALKANLKKILTDILKPCEIPLKIEKKGDMPFVILMVGVNGAGKTTTIGKLALKFKSQGLKVMLGAGDTFRAAAVEQLKEWGKRTDVPVISQPTGSDSASVLFDALSSAKSKNIDVLICDTAGRLQNKDNLMEELKKIVRVMKKISEDVPHEVLLVLDSTTGQNAVSQMRLFSEAVNVTGLCLTKLDGSAKGGVIFALADKFKTPVRFVGIGEKTEDLRVFVVDNFVDALIGDNL